ncbi:GNAT family N-acetyltransferase [Pontibacter arcticus]|uniref:N-acetyltransferase n=1 Tax=Pontibacter arcticus TaxID=2080288 RepID=A0A364RE97_9BACT|nr:GNAT family N-acetyltransferase [Pontibacter arcticus]RAU82668.1 N-acetyltransferase [Pontibacter arcticus]
MAHNVEHDTKYQQFTIKLDNEEAELAYATPSPDQIDFTHTFVPQSARGQGLVGVLMEAGMRYASDNNLKVKATCPAAANYLSKNPQHNHLLL